MLLRILSIPKLLAPGGHLGRICFPKRNFAAKPPAKPPAKQSAKPPAKQPPKQPKCDAPKKPFKPYTIKDLTCLFTKKRLLKNYGVIPLFVVFALSILMKLSFFVYLATSKDDARWIKGSIPVCERVPENLDKPLIRKLVVINDKYIVPEPMRRIYEDKVFDPNEKWV